MIDDKIREFAREIAPLVYNGETEKFMFQFGEELAREKGEEGIGDYLEEIEELKEEIENLEFQIEDFRDDKMALQSKIKDLESELKDAQDKLERINVLSA